MADYTLIDGYLRAIRTKAHRWDVDEVVSELEDHLYSTVEVLIGEGVEPVVAERQTLERFGDLELMADSFASPTRGGPVVPTQFTKKSGTLAVVGGVLWLIAVGLWWAAGVSPPWGDVEYESLNTASGVLYAIGAASVLGAVVLTFVTVVALNRRHGDLGAPGRLGLVFSGLGVVSALAAWILIGWGSMLMFGTILTAVPILRREIAPRLPTLAFGAAMAAGGITAAIFRSVEDTLAEGWVGLWSSEWIPNLTGITVAAILLSFGLIGIGTWLRSETAADADTVQRPVTN